MKAKVGDLVSLYYDSPVTVEVGHYLRTTTGRAYLVDQIRRQTKGQHTEAYPLSVFPEPNFKKARELLEAGGIALDWISASNMRHVVEGVRNLALNGLGLEVQVDKPMSDNDLKPSET